MIPLYVFDSGALVAAERRKERAQRFLRLAHIGRARILVPLPVITEWWRGRTDQREEILSVTKVVASVEIAKAAGVALAKVRNVDAGLTIDAFVMASAALMNAIVVTSDPGDCERLGVHFPGVVVLSI